MFPSNDIIPQNSPQCQQAGVTENDFSLTFTPAQGTTATPEGAYRIVGGAGTDGAGKRFLAPPVTSPVTALERFFAAVGEPLDRPISVIRGNREHFRGSVAHGFARELDTREPDAKHPYRRPDLAHLRTDESPWVIDPNASARPLASLLRGSEGGVTFRPGWVHHENRTWCGSRVIFAEWDDLPLDAQWHKISQLKAQGFPPTAIVFSGSKSIHCYWALSEMLQDAVLWQRIMWKLAIVLGSDPAIATFHREMRLPGGYRFKNGEWREQGLLSANPESRYSPEALESFLDASGLFPLGLDADRFREWKRAVSQRGKFLEKLETGRVSPAMLESYPHEHSPIAVLTSDDWKIPIATPPHAPRFAPDQNPDRDRALILENLDRLPWEWGTPGTGTYEHARNFAWAVASVLGDSEAESVLSPLWPARKIGATIRSRNGKDSGGMGHITRAFKVFGLDVKAWYRDWFARHPEQSTPPDREWEPNTRPAPQDKTLKGRILHFIGNVRAKAKGFQPPAPKEAKSAVDGAVFAPGERIATYQTLARSGYRVVLDRSGTGAGKSHDAGNLRPEDFGASKLIYVSEDHRNPTTDTLKDWADLEARHGGLVKESAPDGSAILRRVAPGSPYSVEPNCSRVGTIAALRAANVDGADSAALVCGGCPLKEACAGSYGGNGFGYLGQKRRTLGRDRFRAHPNSLPAVEDFDYATSVLIIDESIAIHTTKAIDVSLSDLTRTMVVLRDVEGVQDTLGGLYALMERQDLPRYGLTHEELLQVIPGTRKDALVIDELLQPDLAFLNPSQNEGVDVADLPKRLRKFYAAETEEQARMIPKQWFGDFVRILKGDIPGATLRLDNRGLHITAPSQVLRQKIKAARLVVIQDATISPDDLGLKLGVDGATIGVCAQEEVDHGNLKKIQVADLGAMTRQRGTDQERRAGAIADHYRSIDPGTMVIDFKSFQADGAWWVDSRGSNAFQDCKTLILTGTPYENIGALLAQYRAESGKAVAGDDDGFKAWVDRKVTATIEQGVGRLRANRRHNEALTVVLLSNFPIAGFEQVEGRSITPAAGTKAQRALEAIQAAALEITRAGQKLTQAAIASATGFSQGWVSRSINETLGGWDAFKKLLLSLLDPFSKSNKNPDSVDQPELQTLGDMLLHADPPETLPLIEEFLQTFGINTLCTIITGLTPDRRAEILALLLASVGLSPLDFCPLET